MTTKQTMLIVMCTLLVLVVIMGVIVGNKVSDLLFPDSSPSLNQPETEETDATAPGTEQPKPTLPPQTDPTEGPTEPGHEHEFKKDKTVAATCTAYGYTVYKCECGKTDMRDYTDPTGHSYGPGEVIKATCESGGCTRYTCRNCGNVEEKQKVAALGHDYRLVKTVAVTCEKNGYEEYKCTHCKNIIRKNEKSALGHDMGEWKTTEQPTDIKPGKSVRTCKHSGCDKKEEKVLAPAGKLEVTEKTMKTEAGWNCYTIVIGTKKTPKAYTYVVYDCIKGNVDFSYTADGMYVTYTDAKNQTKRHLLPSYDSAVVTIDAKGQVVTGRPKPLIVDPTEPTKSAESQKPHKTETHPSEGKK